MHLAAEPRMLPSTPTFPTTTPAPALTVLDNTDSENEALTAARLLVSVPETPAELTMELIQQVNSDPSVLTLNPALLELFKPTPWLLPKRYPGLPYSNLSSRDLAVVAAARAQPKGEYQKAISVAFFSKGMIRMLQNCIYTMVKFGGVDNYIITTWSESDLEACLDLNLPCADASAYLPEITINEDEESSGDDESSILNISYSIQDRIKSIRETAAAATSSRALLQQETLAPQGTSTNPGSEATKDKATRQKSDVPEFESKAYNRIMWLKPAVVAYLVNQNYAVHSTDVDLAYASKPVWESYLMYLHVAPGAQGVDAAFQIEGDGSYGSPINSGNFVALPTPGTKYLFSAWLALASEKIGEGGNQKGLQKLFKEKRYLLCRTPPECQDAVKKREQIRQELLINSTVSTRSSFSSSPPTIIRTYTPPWWSTKQNFCALSGEYRLPEMDPCNPAFLFLHPVCTPKGSDRVGLKTRVLDKAGFWFIDSKHGCPVEDGNLQSLSEYYNKIEIEEISGSSSIRSNILNVENNNNNGQDAGNLLSRRKRRQYRRLFTAEEVRNGTLNTTSSSSGTDSLPTSVSSPVIEQQNIHNAAVAPRSEEKIRNLEEKKEEEDIGFDENEDLSIYSGRGIQALERCVPLEVRRPGTEAKVANCPSRLAFI
ncbi:hypothetical protein NADE_002275 [Nannochloris sp. 'desiccata']|nr:hypothetical protein NADE_002275 [Chlorella desiccata (nom. nud.)]